MSGFVPWEPQRCVAQLNVAVARLNFAGFSYGLMRREPCFAENLFHSSLSGVVTGKHPARV